MIGRAPGRAEGPRPTRLGQLAPIEPPATTDRGAAGRHALSTETRGMLWGLLGVVGFSLSLPATRAAAPELGAVVVGLGRAVLAGVLAVGLLLALREPWRL